MVEAAAVDPNDVFRGNDVKATGTMGPKVVLEGRAGGAGGGAGGNVVDISSDVFPA